MTTPPSFPTSVERLNAAGVGKLPGYLGIEVIEAGRGLVRARLPLRDTLLAPNGFLHGGSVVALADTVCGYGCALSLPEGGSGFTTIELKANFLGTALKGAIAATGKLAHGGRMTQVWDAEVTDETSGKVIAQFRCTQMVLYRES